MGTITDNLDTIWAKESQDYPGCLTSTVPFEKLEGVTISEKIREGLHKWENAIAFECGVTGRKYTHGEIHAKANSFTASLQEIGLNQEDKVCILLPNIPEFPIVLLGCLDAGLCVSPINPAYTSYEISKQLQDCEARLVVTLSELVPKVQAAKEDSSQFLEFCVAIGDSNLPDGCLDFWTMIKADPTKAKILKGSDIDTANFTALIPYSSGTTGLPKGVEITHSSLVSSLLQVTHMDYAAWKAFEGENEQERLIAVLPYYHMYALHMLLIVSMYQGCRTMCLPKFEPTLFVKTIKELKPTGLHLVTPLLNFLVGCQDISSKDLEDIRFIIATAAPVGNTVISRILEKVGRHVVFQEGYGLTETTTAVTITPCGSRNIKSGSSGTVCAGTTVKILDVETGENVTMKGSPGEVCVKGPQVMKGYFKNVKATQDMFDSEGFLKTGDVGYFDKDKFLFIMDRKKELIKVKGLQVAPGELEDVLRGHPKVIDVAVIGIKHERLGEAPRAYLVTRENCSEDEVREFMKEKVSAHKQLAGGVEFVESIPKSPSGKILRRVILEQFITATKTQ